MAPASTLTASQRPQRDLYANYWEDDLVINPKIVRIVAQYQDRDFWEVVLPGGEHKQVHCHTLGRMHYAV